jgi:RNA polymerase sigma factor (TIGR02999 family)
MTAASNSVTQLLLDWGKGDQTALEQLVPVVQTELQRLARQYLRRERRDHTLQSAALVNEAFLHLVEQRVSWQNRAHFFGVAAQLMRRILVEYARDKNRLKRGGGQQRVSLGAVAELTPAEDVDLIALDDALRSLAALDPQQSRIVELRYFGGLTIAETAEVLGVSHSTIEREWSVARAWLRRELSKG